MRSSKGSPNPRYFLATLTTSRRFFSIRRRLARLSPERAFRERLTSWRRVKRTPLPIFAKYSAKSSGASKPRGAGGSVFRSGSTAGTSVTVPDRIAFLLFTRLPPERVPVSTCESHRARNDEHRTGEGSSQAEEGTRTDSYRARAFRDTCGSAPRPSA